MLVNDMNDDTKVIDETAEAKANGFSYKLEKLNHDYSDRTPVLYGNVWGKDFKLISSGKNETLAAIRVLGALNKHEKEVKSLQEGQELKLARIGKISHFEEYTDDADGYDEYFATKINGVLSIKMISHASNWVGGLDNTFTASIDKFINSWF